MLNVYDLSCLRHQQLLFSHLNFNLSPSELLQVTGPNGSGKSSLLKILVGLLKPYQGEIHWNQRQINPSQSIYRANVWYLGHKIGIKNSLTVLENLKMIVRLYQKFPKKEEPNWNSVLMRFNLQAFAHTLSQQLSAGQRQRLALSRLSLIEAPLWILDEPFTSLDSHATKLLQTLLLTHLVAGGMCILTSHQPLAFAGDFLKTLNLSRD